MLTPRYHIHVDAAHLPSGFSEEALLKHGLFSDNFEHSFEINGVKHPGTHFTRYYFDGEKTAEEMRTECRAIAQEASETGLIGLIQCEFIVEEHTWAGDQESDKSLAPPFMVTMRILNPELGERFKKHELHLEIKKTPSARAVINALLETGLELIQNDRDITFTASGNPRELLLLKKELRKFLEAHGNQFTGKLTYEATAFWSLHGMDARSLPKIIDKVEVLRSL